MALQRRNHRPGYNLTVVPLPVKLGFFDRPLAMLLVTATEALSPTSKPFSDHELLTPRERATLAQIVRGASSKEAAQALGIAPRTVEFHRENIMRKLGAKNTVDLT